MIKVDDIAFVRFTAPDLDAMETFLVDFGLTRAHRDEHDALHARCRQRSVPARDPQGRARFRRRRLPGAQSSTTSQNSRARPTRRSNRSTGRAAANACV